MTKARTDLSKLSDEDYAKYKRAYHAKRQRKWRRMCRKLGRIASSNLSVNQRKAMR